MDKLFSSVLSQAYDEDFKEYQNPPRHLFSSKHRKKMKLLFENAAAKSDSAVISRPVRKRTRLLVMAVILSVLIAIASFASANDVFETFEVFWAPDISQVLPMAYEGSRETIDYIYVPDNLPQGFEIDECYLYYSPVVIYYRNGDDFIYYFQHVKSKYGGGLNTEDGIIEKIEKNGREYLYIDYREEGRFLLWDNGDYILEFITTLSKEEIIELADHIRIQDPKNLQYM